MCLPTCGVLRIHSRNLIFKDDLSYVVRRPIWLHKLATVIPMPHGSTGQKQNEKNIRGLGQGRLEELNSASHQF